MNPDYSQLISNVAGRNLFYMGSSAVTLGGLVSAVVFVVLFWWGSASWSKRCSAW